jgi:putative adenylate-forming enzyme
MSPLLLIELLLARAQLAGRDRWPREKLQAHQASALRAIRAHAVAHSPFYRRLHAGKTARAFTDLPVVTKRMVMDHFDELVTDRAVRLEDVRRHLASERAGESFLGRYWVAATSGTTGSPGVFVHDRREWLTVLASYARANDWAHVRAGLTHRLRLAVVSSRTPWHQSALVGRTLESPFVQALRLDATAPLKETLEQLDRFQPESLVGYASMLRLLANEQIGGRLHIRPLAAMSASEVLTAESRERIRRAWGVNAFDVYAATEPAGIASECEQHTGLHLYEDLVLTEIVDEENRAVPAGTFGAKVLVTVLFRTTQPLIRYEISDRVAAVEGVCACGRPFLRIASVEGRQEDVLTMARGVQGTTAKVHPNVFHEPLDVLPVGAWQVVQTGPAAVRILVTEANGIDDEAVIGAVRSSLRRVGVSEATVRIERVREIPRTALGKAPLVTALP